MRFVKIRVFNILLLIINSSLGQIILLKSLNDDRKLSQTICKITNKVTNSKHHTQDVLIGIFDANVYSSTINDVAQCIDDETAVVITNFKTKITESKLRKASVIILDLGRAGQVNSLILGHHLSTVWHHMANIICILPENININQALSHFNMFTSYGFLNVEIVFKTDKNEIKFITMRSLDMKIILYDNMNTFFRDKLKDMKGFSYEIAVHDQVPRVMINKKIVSSLTYFFDALKTIQNSNYKIIRSTSSRLRQLWISRTIHLTFNTDIVFDTSEPKLLTYEKKGYCAIIPLPPKISLFRLIFIKPFDGLTWMFLALSIVSSVVVFWMFRGRGAVDSPLLLGYGMFVYFIGQGVDFSRRNRMVLTILIQLIIVMMWIISNAYEGVITSFMIQPMQENRLKTVEDLWNSKCKVVAGDAFMYSVRSDQFLKSRIEVSKSNLYLNNDTCRVYIKTCDLIELELSKATLKGHPLSDYYYILPEPISSQFVFLEASYLNPFLDRLQYYMDLSFQAGLPQIWKIYADQDFYKKLKGLTSDEPVYLKLRDLVQVLILLVVGFLLSIILFLIEIVFRDWLELLRLKYLGYKLRNKVSRRSDQMKKRKSKDLKYQRGALYYIMHRHQKIKRLEHKRLKIRQIFKYR